MANLCRHHHYHSSLGTWISFPRSSTKVIGAVMCSPSLVSLDSPCCSITGATYVNGPVFVLVQMNFNGWSSSNDQHHVVLSCTIFQPRGSIIIEASNVDSFRHTLVSCSPDAAMKCWPGCNTARPDLRFGIFRGLKLWGGPFPWTAAACSRTESVNSPRASNNVTLPASGCPSGFEKGAVAPTKALVLHDKPCFFLVVPPKFSYKLNSNHPSSEEPAIKSTASISRNIPPDSRRKALSQQCTKTLSAEHMTQNLPLKTIFGLLQIPLNPSKPSKPPAAKLQPNLPRGRL